MGVGGGIGVSVAGSDAVSVTESEGVKAIVGVPVIPKVGVLGRDDVLLKVALSRSQSLWLLQQVSGSWRR